MAVTRELPLAIQTNYAELLDQLRIAQRATFGQDVQFRKKTIKGRDYWYARSATGSDGARKERYLGPDSDELRALIENDREVSQSTDTRRLIVRSLVAAGLPAPDPATGTVLKALSDAGVFRLRAVVVGTVAFQMYGGGLGVILPGAAVRTGDLDIAQDYGVSLAIDDAVEQPMIDILRSADPGFRAVPSTDNPLVANAYAAPSGLRVDILTTNRGADRTTSKLAALRSDATPLRFMDFLLREPMEAAVLHDAGVWVRVPQPPRFAVHKLLVSRRRRPGSAKGLKDLMQAGALIEVLARRDPYILARTYAEALERGPGWRELLEEATSLLPAQIASALKATLA